MDRTCPRCTTIVSSATPSPRACPSTLQESAKASTAPLREAYDFVLRIRRFRVFREVGAMWRQLSGFDKFRFVCCVLGLPATVLATILNAIDHQWVKTAIQALLVFSLSYYLYKLATRVAARENPNLTQSTQERHYNSRATRPSSSGSSFTSLCWPLAAFSGASTSSSTVPRRPL